jgi:hypothetical protein
MAAVMAVGIMGGDVEAAAFAAENAARYNSLSTYNQEIPIVERQIEEAENEEQAAFLREYSKTILPDNMRADRAAALPLPEFMQRRITPINASIQETYNETQTFLQSCDQASPILGRMIRNQVWPVELGLKWIRLPTTLGGAIDLGAVVSGAGTGVIRNAGTTITNTLKGSLKSMVSALRGAGTNASRLVPTGLGKPLSLQSSSTQSIEKVVLELELKVGMDTRDFQRKFNALSDLAERGKLIKAPNPVSRNPSLTRQYRQQIIKKAELKHGENNPEMLSKIKDRVSRMDVDHQHELQLLGSDSKNNLSLLDKKTNQEIGTQIRKQVKDLPDGTKIDSIIKKEVSK